MDLIGSLMGLAHDPMGGETQALRQGFPGREPGTMIHGGFHRWMGTPNSWMVYFRENPI